MTVGKVEKNEGRCDFYVQMAKISNDVIEDYVRNGSYRISFGKAFIAISHKFREPIVFVFSI